MEKQSSKPNILPIKPIIEAARESVTYIEERRKGNQKSLLTPWEKYNAVSMNGLEWQSIHSFAGMSGSGKTAFINQLETNLPILNPDEDFNILSFNFEMLARNLVSRKFSNSLKMTVQELHSGRQGTNISDQVFNNIVDVGKSISKLPIYYVETPGSVIEIFETILDFYNRTGKGVVVILDHATLVKGQRGEMERVILSELMIMFNYLKKTIKIITVILSQMNREIESTDRLNDPNMQYPKKKDVFGGDSLYQFSDMLSVIMNPEMLGLENYGPQRLPTKGFIYIHCLKNREGEPAILRMANMLKYNEIRDYYSAETLYNFNDV